MPRCKKIRMVSSLPKCSRFQSNNCNNMEVTMTVDEFETIKLIDYYNLTQEECAKKMEVARTTIQQIYSDARKKLSQMLVENRPLKIDGGSYKLCEGKRHGHCHNNFQI